MVDCWNVVAARFFAARYSAIRSRGPLLSHNAEVEHDGRTVLLLGDF